MKKKNNRKIIFSYILIIFIIGFISFFVLFFSDKKQKYIEQKQPDVSVGYKIQLDTQPQAQVFRAKQELQSLKEEYNTSYATLKITDQEFIVPITNDTTVYDAMYKLSSEGKIKFEGKEYVGLGFFVTAVNSLKSGNGKNLIYYINNTQASVGISTYVIQEGDVIEWKLE